MKAKPIILVVDDQPQNIELLEAYLVPRGYEYEIVTAANGEEALEKLSGNQIDLILLDVMMPGMDGFEVTRRVRQDDMHRLLPIILITALQKTEDRIKGIEAGCDDFISKPVDKIELLARVRSLLKVKAYSDLMSNYRKELESEVTGRTEELKHTLENLQQEITERKQAEETLRENQRRLADIVTFLPDATLAIDKEKRIIIWNKAIEEMTGVPAAEMIGKGDYAYTIPFYGEARPQLMDLVFLDQKEIAARYPNITREGDSFMTEVFCNALYNNKGAWVFGKASPLRDQFGNIIGAIESIRDITERKRAEEELKRTFESLRKAVGATIQTMVSAVEMRDPYTAGHQLRTANLACAIATEIGLPQEKIDGIRMAGSIHDIGKLSIPAEILSKPTKLTNIEFSLIKEHSQKGYEMLKDVESPWPLAEIVYQHHERMNGSGYPRNLKGDEILMEARIMAVADVVEAMASHRPYRPALGIEAALEEIEKNKGTLYDNTVADTCLRLFREKGFQFEGTRL